MCATGIQINFIISPLGICSVLNLHRTYHFENFGTHKRFDQRKDFIEERYNVEYVDLTQCARDALLHVTEEFPNGSNAHTCQMSDAHIPHIKQKDEATLRTEFVQANVCKLI